MAVRQERLAQIRQQQAQLPMSPLPRLRLEQRIQQIEPQTPPNRIGGGGIESLRRRMVQVHRIGNISPEGYLPDLDEALGENGRNNHQARRRQGARQENVRQLLNDVPGRPRVQINAATARMLRFRDAALNAR